MDPGDPCPVCGQSHHERSEMSAIPEEDCCQRKATIHIGEFNSEDVSKVEDNGGVERGPCKLFQDRKSLHA